MTYSEKYADFILSLKFEQLDSRVIDKAKSLMIDTVGTALAGSNHETVDNIINGIRGMSSHIEDYSAWGRKERLSLEYATMINGVSSHVLDFDDTHTEAILHGSSILTPLCLTYGFGKTHNGKKVLTAFIAGWEIAARVGISSSGSFHQRGFHSTAIAGIFGAVAAVSVILSLNKNQIINAFGLAGSFASGINEFLSNGSNSKVLHIANAIRNSIFIANLVKNDVTGPRTVFEGRDNIFKCFGISEKFLSERLDFNLGKEWEILNVSIKPYPCCHFAHGLIDCIKDVRKDGVSAFDIESIHCYVDPVPAKFICEPIEKKRSPNTAYEAKFSMPFLLSLMFHDGKIILDSYNDLNRKEILDLSNKISYEERNSHEFPKTFPGYLTVYLKNGRTIDKHVSINKGNRDNPLSKHELEDKFYDNSKNIVSKSNHILEYIYNLEAQNEILNIEYGG